MTKVLILGKSGMLGSMVFHYLSNNSLFKVLGTERDTFNVENFLRDPYKFSEFKHYDFIINCIGVIKPYCKDNDSEGVKKAIKINALFPNELSDLLQDSNARIMQIATDCVFSGEKGNYDENFSHDPIDVYGMTKSLGEVHSGNFLNIRCSIIGPELNHNLGLLGWFLTQKKGFKLNGFINHKWNGVTTLQFARLCKLMMENGNFDQLSKTGKVFHFCPNDTITKYDLLSLFNKIFKKDVEIEKSEAPRAKDMTLRTKYKLTELFGNSTIEKSLTELKEYMNNLAIYKY